MWRSIIIALICILICRPLPAAAAAATCSNTCQSCRRRAHETDESRHSNLLIPIHSTAHGMLSHVVNVKGQIRIRLSAYLAAAVTAQEQCIQSMPCRWPDRDHVLVPDYHSTRTQEAVAMQLFHQKDVCCLFNVIVSVD